MTRYNLCNRLVRGDLFSCCWEQQSFPAAVCHVGDAGFGGPGDPPSAVCRGRSYGAVFLGLNPSAVRMGFWGLADLHIAFYILCLSLACCSCGPRIVYLQNVLSSRSQRRRRWPIRAGDWIRIPLGRRQPVMPNLGCNARCNRKIDEKRATHRRPPVTSKAFQGWRLLEVGTFHGPRSALGPSPPTDEPHHVRPSSLLRPSLVAQQRSQV